MASGRLIDYLGSGAIADRPATPDLAAGSVGLWFDIGAGVLSAWDGSVWSDIAGGGGGSWGSITGTLSDQADLQASLNAKATIGAIGINTQTGTSYTLVLGDAGKDVSCNNAAAFTLTVPPHSSVAFPVGTFLFFSQAGTGTVTATSGSGVTLNAANGVTTSARYDVRGLEQVAIDVWRVL